MERIFLWKRFLPVGLYYTFGGEFKFMTIWIFFRFVNFKFTKNFERFVFIDISDIMLVIMEPGIPILFYRTNAYPLVKLWDINIVWVVFFMFCAHQKFTEINMKWMYSFITRQNIATLCSNEILRISISFNINM